MHAFFSIYVGQYFLVEWKREDPYTVLTGKSINQTKTSKSLSDLNVSDTVVAKWGAKEFEVTILKVGRFIQLPLP